MRSFAQSSFVDEDDRTLLAEAFFLVCGQRYRFQGRIASSEVTPNWVDGVRLAAGLAEGEAPRIVAAGPEGLYPDIAATSYMARFAPTNWNTVTAPRWSLSRTRPRLANISRSSRSTQFSGHSRVSSSRSLVIKPSLRRPSSGAACSTHCGSRWPEARTRAPTR
jgi:hypothetical protein